eukprot:scaffold173084_cov40-Cyclotella_meneghiniana.AAC.3
MRVPPSSTVMVASSSLLTAARSTSAFLSCQHHHHTHTSSITRLSATAAALHDTSLSPGIAAIDAALPTLSPLFHQLRSLPYFSLYSVDMLA